MNEQQVSVVLAKCAAFDSRIFGDAEVRAWYEAVGDLDFDDAMPAVARFYATSRQRMWPADLRQLVAVIRAERAAASSRSDQEHL